VSLNITAILVRKMMNNAGEKLSIFPVKTAKKMLSASKNSITFQLAKMMIMNVGKNFITDLTVKKETWTV
jgi:hypothetical protein